MSFKLGMILSGFSKISSYESGFKIAWHQNVLSVNLILMCNSHSIV